MTPLQRRSDAAGAKVRRRSDRRWTRARGRRRRRGGGGGAVAARVRLRGTIVMETEEIAWREYGIVSGARKISEWAAE